MEAMKSDVDEIALQGIEFWSTVCDEEVDLAIELSEVLRFNIFLFFSIMMFHLIARTCSNFDKFYAPFFSCRLLSKGDHQNEPVDSTLKALCSIYLLSCYTAWQSR